MKPTKFPSLDISHLSEEEKVKRLNLLKEIKHLETRKSQFHESLPHLYKFKFYTWARNFFKSTNKMNFLCAANQIGKSTTNIRKCIEWATNVKFWARLWPHKTPKVFWYIYPSAEVATIEWHTKWRDLMPCGDFETSHPLYGWKANFDSKKNIKSIEFASGITIFFKTHTQSAQNLQAATVDAVFADEELPEHLYSEISFRIIASNGYFHMVFTATLGQEIWRRTMEPRDDEIPLFPDALKICASLYDCEFFEDGTPTHWTPARVLEVEAKCKSETERLRRVMGRFVSEEGRLYGSFEPELNRCEPMPVPPTGWHVYVGVDPGSSGSTGHPAAISFVAVAPDYKRGRVFRAWRGTTDERTTAGDVFEKYLQMSRDIRVVERRYDWSAADFATISERAGVTFNKAAKARDLGVSAMNTLFKARMLELCHGDPEVDKLSSELLNVKTVEKSNERRGDDLCDATRYAITAIPWNWEGLNFVEEERQKQLSFEQDRAPTEKELQAEEIERRRGQFARKPATDSDWEDENGEFEYWSGLGGN